MVTTILLFVIILGLLVFVHELGHFITAKRMGIRVEEFGFGFPPRLWGIKRGDTLYSINAVPLGGFVRIKGEAGDEAQDPDSFAHKHAWQRVLILSAGVIMNFLLAFVLLSAGFMIGMPQEINDEDIALGRAVDPHLVIIDVAQESVASEAGLRAGDRLISINGNVFNDEVEAVDFIQQHNIEQLTVVIARGDELNTYELTPASIDGLDRPVLGVAMIRAGLVRYDFFTAWLQGGRATVALILAVIVAFWHLIVGLFQGTGIGNQVSGPVGVAVLTGQIAQLGIPYLINFTAMLSINLGILNILPFPALDGGRVLFVLIEKIKGKPVSPKIEGVFHNIGFILLIGLVIFITYRDVSRYGGQILSGLTTLFN